MLKIVGTFCFLIFILFNVTACKQRQEVSSEAKTELAYVKTGGRISFLNAHQLAYLAYFSYENRATAELLASEMSLTLEAAEDIEGTYYFIVSTEDYIVVSFRGTEKNPEDLWTDLKFFHRIFDDGAVHCGFCQAYGKVKAKISNTLKKLYHENPREVFFTGHSLGGALANIAALDSAFYMQEYAATVPYTLAMPYSISGLYTFGAPKVFDENGAAFSDRHVPSHYRFVYGNDFVTTVPTKKMDFKHAGKKIWFDNPSCNLIVERIFNERKISKFALNLEKLQRLIKLTAFKDHSLANYQRCLIKLFR